MDIGEVSRFRNETEKSVLRLNTCKKPNNDGRCYVVTVWKPWERERERGAKTISDPPRPVLSVASNEEATNASRSLCRDPDRDDLLSEGYDDNPFNLLGPAYWRVTIRANEKLYASTFVATREAIRKCWGSAGLAHCDPITGNRGLDGPARDKRRG
jgi:hypothetical protein